MSAEIEHTSRQVIENALLTALTEKAQVAILATEEDLNLLINALHNHCGSKSKQMAEDFEKLRQAAFGK